MSRVIKLKQSDIEQIVNNLVEQHHHGHHYDDFDMEIQPEELPNDDLEFFDDKDFQDDRTNFAPKTQRDPNTGDLLHNDDKEEENMGIDEQGENPNPGNVMVVKDKQGRIYVVKDPNSENPQIFVK